MKQWHEAKSARSATTLLFLSADFCEFFGADAVEAVRAHKLKLTSGTRMKEP